MKNCAFKVAEDATPLVLDQVTMNEPSLKPSTLGSVCAPSVVVLTKISPPTLLLLASNNWP